MYRDIPDDLRRCIEPVVEHHGLELVNVDRVNGPGQALLRITIDNPNGDGRVEVDRLARVSREVESQLDASDAMSGPYRLELSSPGLDRMLAREKDFAAACGREIKLKTRRPLDGRRRFRGTLVAFEDGQARLAVDGEEVRIAFEDVEKANTIYEFSPADFNGTGSSRVAD